jgi:predicted nucleic acid-binding protein
MIIVDSNVISALMLATPDPVVLSWFDRQPTTSIWTTSITIFEIRFGLEIMPAGRRRSNLQAQFERVIDEDLEQRVLAFDPAAAKEAATLMANRQRTGRVGDLRDTMIASIALTHRATLATRNVRHFQDLSVPVVDPWQTP